MTGSPRPVRRRRRGRRGPGRRIRKLQPGQGLAPRQGHEVGSDRLQHQSGLDLLSDADGNLTPVSQAYDGRAAAHAARADAEQTHLTGLRARGAGQGPLPSGAEEGVKPRQYADVDRPSRSGGGRRLSLGPGRGEQPDQTAGLHQQQGDQKEFHEAAQRQATPPVQGGGEAEVADVSNHDAKPVPAPDGREWRVEQSASNSIAIPTSSADV